MPRCACVCACMVHIYVVSVVSVVYVVYVVYGVAKREERCDAYQIINAMQCQSGLDAEDRKRRQQEDLLVQKRIKWREVSCGVL